MKVSIITATYNSAKTVTDALHSVLEQTYKDIECVVVDGASSDNTSKIVNDIKARYPNRSVVWHSERDKGIYDALNRGIELASGDVIGFVHSDDFLAQKDIIQYIVNCFNSQKCDGIYGNLHYVSFKNTDRILRNWVGNLFKQEMLKQGWMPAHPTLYLKSDVYRDYGKFNLDYKISADYDFILRIFKQSQLQFHYLPKTVVKMRLGGASNKNLSNIILKLKEDYKAIKQNKIGGLRTIFLKNTSKIKQFIS